jgi:hypothetical protein
LAKDFFDEALRKINEWLQVEGFALPNKILIAEPLSLGAGSLANEAWLTEVDPENETVG